MPKLDPTEIGEVGSLRCRCADCNRGAMESGDGFELPFCRRHLTKLSRFRFDALVRVSARSVFDIDAVAEAAALVATARLELRRKKLRA
jgi:hypothetical protein